MNGNNRRAQLVVDGGSARTDRRTAERAQRRATRVWERESLAIIICVRVDRLWKEKQRAIRNIARDEFELSRLINHNNNLQTTAPINHHYDSIT